MRKLVVVVAVVLLASLMPAEAKHRRRLGPPYQKPFELIRCGEGTFSTCTATGRFKPSDGTIDLKLRVAAEETPGVGRNHAIGVAWFTVDQVLRHPAKRLAYEVDVRVDRARALVDGLYANTVGLPGRGFSFAQASFVIFSKGCGCPGSTGNIDFVSTRHPGVPSDLEGTTITLRATLDPEGGDSVPAGPVKVVFLFHARVELGWSVAPSAPVPDTGKASLGFAGRVVKIRRVA